MFTKASIPQYISLNETEEAVLAEFERIIKTGTQEEKKQASMVLSSYLPETVFKLSVRSLDFKIFCEDGLLHKTEWIAYLQAGHYPGYDISSQSNGKKCTTYCQYVGAYLFEEIRKMKDPQSSLAVFLLDKTCEIGFLYALIDRCELNLLKIHNGSLSGEKETFARDQIERDLLALCDMYWSLGSGFASKIYLQLGAHYNKQEGDEEHTLSSKYTLLGVKTFCSAELLLKNKISKDIVDFIVEDNNFFEFVFDKHFENWAQAKYDYILKFIKDDTKLYDSLRQSAEEEISAPQNPPSNGYSL